MQVNEYNCMADEAWPTRFEKFSTIKLKYIKEGSNFEINIETKMRNEVTKVGPLTVEREKEVARSRRGIQIENRPLVI